MTNLIPKLATQTFFGFLMLTFTVVACNNNKEDKKETTKDSTVAPMDPVPMPMDTTKMDTASPRPVKDPGVDPVKDPN